MQSRLKFVRRREQRIAMPFEHRSCFATRLQHGRAEDRYAVLKMEAASAIRAMTMAVSTPSYRPTSDGHCEVILGSGFDQLARAEPVAREAEQLLLAAADRTRVDVGEPSEAPTTIRRPAGSKDASSALPGRPCLNSARVFPSSTAQTLAVPSALAVTTSASGLNSTLICPHHHGASHISAFVTHVANAYKATRFRLGRVRGRVGVRGRSGGVCPTCYRLRGTARSPGP